MVLVHLEVVLGRRGWKLGAALELGSGIAGAGPGSGILGLGQAYGPGSGILGPGSGILGPGSAPGIYLVLGLGQHLALCTWLPHLAWVSTWHSFHSCIGSVLAFLTHSWHLGLVLRPGLAFLHLGLVFTWRWHSWSTWAWSFTWRWHSWSTWAWSFTWRWHSWSTWAGPSPGAGIPGPPGLVLHLEEVQTLNQILHLRIPLTHWSFVFQII